MEYATNNARRERANTTQAGPRTNNKKTGCLLLIIVVEKGSGRWKRR